VWRYMARTTRHKRKIEELLEETILLLKKLLDRQAAITAKGALDMKTVNVGDSSVFTFTEFDGLNGTGKIVKSSGPISFASDNVAVATVDSTRQTINPDGSVSVPVVAVGFGVANITGVDSASVNKVAAGDILTVNVQVSVALSATGVLS
jgi:uncharacterized spore protein YtfJ